ncbi:MAG: HAD family hydrolase [Anaerolineales bacterium]|nr:HAD family hydrolase [Anaerolineales bacterium]
MKKQFKCVFFDWDLTLVRVLGDVSPEERLTALFQKEGLPYTLREVQDAIRRYQEDLQTGKIKRPSSPQTQRDISRYYQDILLRLNHNDRDWERVTYLYNAYAHLPQIPYEETIPVLQALQEKELKLGIISNHSRLIRPAVEKLLGGYISPDMVIISQELGVHKPAKTIYRAACARAQVAATDCVFVGNHLFVDAIGAVEEGEFGLGLWLDRLEGFGTMPELPAGMVRITSLWDVLAYV